MGPHPLVFIGLMMVALAIPCIAYGVSFTIRDAQERACSDGRLAKAQPPHGDGG